MRTRTHRLIHHDGTDAVGMFTELFMLYQENIIRFTQEKDWDGLIAYLKRVMKNTQKDHWLTMQLAIAYLQKGDHSETRQTLRKAFVLHNDCIMVPFVSGLLFLEKADWKTAIDFLGIVTETGVDSIFERSSCPCCAEKHQAQTIVADSSFLLSECYEHLGRYDLAKEHRELHQGAVESGVESLYVESEQDDDE